MSWKDKFMLGDPVSVEHQVGEATVKFYAIRGSTALRLRSVAPILTQAFATLFDDRKRDTGQISRQVDGGEKGESYSEIIIEARAPEMAKLRTDQINKALNSVVASLHDESTKDLLVQVLLDSMRDEFKDDKPTPSEFLEFFDLIMIRDMIIGCVKANSKVFGSFSDAMGKLSARALASVEAKVQSLEEDLESPEDQNES